MQIENKESFFLKTTMLKRKNLFVNFTQKRFSCNNNITYQKLLYTYTIGVILRYLRIVRFKHLRKDLKGFKLFFNLIKNIFIKKFLKKKNINYIIHYNSFGYNTNYILKELVSLLNGNNLQRRIFLILTLRLSFNKKREKRIRSIKKRIKKKILSNFLKMHRDSQEPNIFKQLKLKRNL